MNKDINTNNLSEEILSIIEQNNKFTNEQLASMLGVDVKEVENTIKKLEDENIILGYTTIVNWEKTSKEFVTALIEVKVSPQRGDGFDKIAQRISKFPEVKSVILMSGTFDLLVIIEGKTLMEVSTFVSQKLAPLDTVLSTVTHFILKKYKDNGIIFAEKEKDTREAITL